MFQPQPWPQAIVHLDGDAFFASVIQATRPCLRGTPVVVGKERGIATAISYEAKKLYSISRGTPIYEIRSRYPDCHIVESDYRLFHRFSQRMFQIMESFTPTVERYSIDEGFADIKGLRRPLNLSYPEIGGAMKKRIEGALGINVSVGIAVTKSLAKLASAQGKPDGLTIVPGPRIEKLLENVPTKEVWGIGPNTSAYLDKLGIKTALELAQQTHRFIKEHFSKPVLEIWQELRGKSLYQLNCEGKTSYQTITRSRTFHPPTNDYDILWSKLRKHTEEAFHQARKFNYRVGKVSIFLKTQDFHYRHNQTLLPQKALFPLEVKGLLKKSLRQVYSPRHLYRTVGCKISNLVTATNPQLSLLNRAKKVTRDYRPIYQLYQEGKIDFGTRLWDQPAPPEKNNLPELPLPLLTLG